MKWLSDNWQWVVEAALALVSMICAIISVKKAAECKQYADKIENYDMRNNRGTITNIANQIVNDEKTMQAIALQVSDQITREALQQYTADGHPPVYVCDDTGKKVKAGTLIAVRR